MEQEFFSRSISLKIKGWGKMVRAHTSFFSTSGQKESSRQGTSAPRAGGGPYAEALYDGGGRGGGDARGEMLAVGRHGQGLGG